VLTIVLLPRDSRADEARKIFHRLANTGTTGENGQLFQARQAALFSRTALTRPLAATDHTGSLQMARNEESDIARRLIFIQDLDA
jgi:hypothetical protein